MESITLRIKELIDHQGLNNGEFAKVINVNPSIISHILSGRNKPSLQLIESIKSEFTNVNLDYLLTGKGSLFNEITNVNTEDEVESFPDLTSVSGFPMDGVRHAAIPGSMPSYSQEAAGPVPKEKPANDKSGPAPTLPSAGSEEDIEQIVVFYKNGTFKVYRSATS